MQDTDLENGDGWVWRMAHVVGRRLRGHDPSLSSWVKYEVPVGFHVQWTSKHRYNHNFSVGILTHG
jgi:hypothetical protein